ncbi:MAG: hypothetical protein QM800_12775 [Paludibacter sp.]
MEKIKIEYPNLEHFQLNELHKEIDVPEEMIELIKQLIPFYISIGTCYKKGTPAADETEMLRNRNKKLREKILSFNWTGEIIFVINNIPFIVNIYEEQQYDYLEIDIHTTKLIKYDFEFIK